MEEKKVIKIFTFILLTAVLFIPMLVKADGRNFDMRVEGASGSSDGPFLKYYKKGDIVEFNGLISDAFCDSDNFSIVTDYPGYLKFDSNVFELVSVDGVENFSTIDNIKLSNGILTFTHSILQCSKDYTKYFTIKLRVKDDSISSTKYFEDENANYVGYIGIKKEEKPVVSQEPSTNEPSDVQNVPTTEAKTQEKKSILDNDIVVMSILFLCGVLFATTIALLISNSKKNKMINKNN